MGEGITQGLDGRRAKIPSSLVERYRNDARFHALVRMLAAFLHDGELHAADLGDAVIVAEELRRQREEAKR